MTKEEALAEFAEFYYEDGFSRHWSKGMDTSTGAWRARCKCGWLSEPCGDASEPRRGPTQAFQLLCKHHLNPILEKLMDLERRSGLNIHTVLAWRLSGED